MTKLKPNNLTEPFPVDALPKPVTDICKEISNSFEVPLELPCTTALGLLAACCQTKAIVRYNATYSEQPNLFTLAISDTGDRKSNVFRLLREAVISAQQEYFTLNEDRIAESRLERNLLKKRRDAAEREMIQNPEETVYTLEDIKRLDKEIRDFELLVAPRFLVDDATSEKLIDLLEEQRGSIAIASPEGGLFSTLRTAASANPTFDAYLKAYTGDSIEVARLSRKGNYIETPKLSLIIACQPKTAMEMIENKTFRDKGLPARFLFANCRSLIGKRTFDKPEVANEAIEAYNSLIHKLLDGVFDRSTNTPETELTLTTASRSAYIKFSQSIEAKLGDNGEYKFMQDWCAKLPGQVLRIAGILTLCDNNHRIEVEAMNSATVIASWLIESAAAVFGKQDSVMAGLLGEGFTDSLLTRFLDECTTPGKIGYTKTSDLLKHYKVWAQRNGCDDTATSKEFVGTLKKKHEVKRNAKGNVVKDIALF